MLDAASRRRKRRPSPAIAGDRFECWSIREAAVLFLQLDMTTAGYWSGHRGEPCPGTAAPDSFRLGWEIGATAAGHVPQPAWLASLAAQARAGCAGSA